MLLDLNLSGVDEDFFIQTICWTRGDPDHSNIAFK